MKKIQCYEKVIVGVFTFLLFSVLSQAQLVTVPRASQKASVSQQVGISTIAITYHSPATKERKIWGGLVPYGQVWRAGANENTLIEFSDNVKVEGQELNAGTYGLYMLPSENSVDIIFSSATKNWGTVIPTAEETILTVSVSPQVETHEEWLSYGFDNRGDNDVTVELRWEKWRIPFNVEVDVNQVVLNNLHAEMKGVAGFGYQGSERAARYCLQNDVDTDQGIKWIDQSIAAEKRFSNLSVKSGLLKKAGKMLESDTVMEEAMTMANSTQLNNYGYQLMNGGNVDGATKIFLDNIANTAKSHPFYWGFVDSVGEAYLKNNDITNALKYYRLAKTYAPDNRQAYLDGVIGGIVEKKN